MMRSGVTCGVLDVAMFFLADWKWEIAAL